MAILQLHENSWIGLTSTRPINARKDQAQGTKSSSLGTPRKQRLEKARSLIDGITKRLHNEEHDRHLSGSDAGSSCQEGSENGMRQNVRDLIQISIPEVDRFIKTKQQPLTGAQVYCIPIEEVEDVLARRLTKIWSELDANHCEIEDQLDKQIDAIQVYQAENLMSKPSDSNAGGLHVGKYDKKMRTETEKETRLLELIEMANDPYEVTDGTHYIVQLCASILRGVNYKYLLMHTTIYVYNHNKPMSKVVSKVVKGCEPDKQKAFAALFTILERNSDMVTLKCPDDRWAEIDNEARKNIDRLFARGRGKKASSETQFELAKNSMKKRKRHVLTELGAEEQRRFMRMRTNIAKKLVEYVSAIESTKSLLDMVEPDDNETREELENTLRNVQEMHEKTKNDQQRLEAQYKEFRNRSYGPRKKKRYVQEKQSTQMKMHQCLRTTALRNRIQNNSSIRIVNVGTHKLSYFQ
ncbi:hypothetical protein OSTOST_25869 [Ostertagia ostertagi]